MLLSASRGCWHSLAPDYVILISASDVTSCSPLPLPLLCPSYKGPRKYGRPTRIIPENLPTKSLNSITPAAPLLPCKLTLSGSENGSVELLEVPLFSLPYHMTSGAHGCWRLGYQHLRGKTLALAQHLYL